MMNRIADEIKKSEKISMICHTSPDADTLGSCFALKRALADMGKSVTLYSDCTLPGYLDYLYDNYEIYTSPVSSDLCLCIDCGDLGRIGDREALIKSAALSINIDHHHTNTGYADINYVDASAAATGEIIYELLLKLEAKTDEYICTALYSALTGDTGSFRYSNTTPKTMIIASKLLEGGADPWFINRRIFEEKSLSEIRLTGELSQNIKSEEDGKICSVILKRDMCGKYNIDISDVDNIIEIPRKVKDCEVAASFKEHGGKTKISLRSVSYVDVSKIAMFFGGGGHVRAAGFVLDCGIDEAYEKVVSKVKEELAQKEER